MMSVTTMLALLSPVLWLALVWALNRMVVDRPRPARLAMFCLTGLSPLLALMLWLGLHLAQFGYEPKMPVILIEIGLPAALIALAFAGWGSSGRHGPAWARRRRR